MNTLAAGAVVALLVAGYPLYQLVTTGNLDPTSALVRGGVVAGACTAGIAAIVQLALSWEAQTRTDREHRLNSLFSDMEGAMANGTLKDEDAAASRARAAPKGPAAPTGTATGGTPATQGTAPDPS